MKQCWSVWEMFCFFPYEIAFSRQSYRCKKEKNQEYLYNSELLCISQFEDLNIFVVNLKMLSKCLWMTHIEILKYMYTHFKVAFGVRKDGGRKGEEGKNVTVIIYLPPTPPPSHPLSTFNFLLIIYKGLLFFRPQFVLSVSIFICKLDKSLWISLIQYKNYPNT